MSYRLCFNNKMFQLKFSVSVLTLLLCHYAPAFGLHDTDNSCVLRLYEASGNIAPSSCITYNDIEAAFFRAKRKVGLRRPAIVKDEQAVAHLGLALQEATRILAQRFYLNVNQTDILLTSVDTSRTEIGKYCAHALRGKERCQEEGYRRHDATCNNLENPSWGASGLPFKRLLLPEYADRISEPKVSKNGYPLPLARLVSTTVHGHKPIRHQHLITFMFASWGQFVDHDLTLTAETKDPVSRKDVNCCGNSERHPNCLPIEIPENDPFYSKHPYRKRCIHFARSLNGVRYGCKLGSRVQTNRLTSYIDASFMYGSNMRVADSLRTLQGGLMKIYPAFDDKKMKPLLPLKTVQPDDGCFRANADDFCFLAGDNRVNEQLGLGVLHTLVVREHNRIAKELSTINPKWDDEIIYQETRNIMAAVVQHITYNEFLPQLLGEELITKYNLSLQTRLGRNGFSYDYNPKIDATIPYAFAMAAYRFGHSLLPDKMEKRSSSHHLIGERNLREILQQPYDLYIPGSMDAYTLGMINQLSQGMDSAITQEVTNHLFEEPSRLSGRDLAATNIQRGREHGLPGYLAYRRWCELETVSSWDEMWKLLPNSTVNLYRSIYRYPEDIDLWSAGVSEDPAPGSLIGPLFGCIIATTFKNLKLGDRFWYENGGFRNSFTRAQLNEIRKYTLARLLCNTGDNIQTVQRLAMLMPDHHKNQRVSCRSKEIPDINLHFWKEIESSDNYYTRPSLLPPIIDNIVTPSTQPPDIFTKPPGFDQVVYNLVNQKPLNFSSSSLHNYYSFADNTSNIFLIKL